jgi:hypothetical protein
MLDMEELLADAAIADKPYWKLSPDPCNTRLMM